MRKFTVSTLIVVIAAGWAAQAHAALSAPWSGNTVPGGTVTLSGSCTGFDENGNQVPGTFSSEVGLFEAKGPPPNPSTLIGTFPISFNTTTGAYSATVVIPSTAVAGENVYTLGALTCVRPAFGETVSAGIDAQSFTLTGAAPTTADPATPAAPTTVAPVPAAAPPAAAPPAAAPPRRGTSCRSTSGCRRSRSDADVTCPACDRPGHRRTADRCCGLARIRRALPRCHPSAVGVTLADKNAEAMQRTRSALAPSLQPGEPLLGCVYATRQSTFSGSMWAVGITPERLVLVQLDRKMAPKGDAITIRPPDVTGWSINGWALSTQEAAMRALSGNVALRITTASEKWKLSVIGGVVGDRLVDDDYTIGLDAITEFLTATD